MCIRDRLYGLDLFAVNNETLDPDNFLITCYDDFTAIILGVLKLSESVGNSAK